MYTVFLKKNLIFLLIIILILYNFNILYESYKNKENKINIIYPNNFKIGENIYLFTDLFISGNDIIGVTKYYNNINFNKIEIYVNNKKRFFDVIHIHKNSNEQSVICILKNVTIKKKMKIIVKYMKFRKQFILYKPDYKKYYLTMSTLFKDDEFLLKSWIMHYKKIGVEHFYLYYNGKITDKLLKYFDNIDRKLFTLIEWNYTYWVGPNIHLAQITEVNNSIYKYRYNSKYIAFFDLDEYIVCKNLKNILKKYNSNNVASIIFNNSWADIKNFNFNRLKLNYNNFKNYKIIRDNIFEKAQTKHIINPLNIKNNGIHVVRNMNNKKFTSYKTNYYFLHFYKFSLKNRKDNKIKKQKNELFFKNF